MVGGPQEGNALAMFSFGDSFDLYAAPTDAINGYWDGGTTVNAGLVTGRFAGSRGLQQTTGSSVTASLFKNGANDPLHHIVVAIQQITAITGSSNYQWFTLSDAGTAQCSVVFRSDGAILLQSGATGGTTLATYTGAVTAQNTWYAFEIEVFISSTGGYMNVRKNGNTVNDFASATNLNTRPGTANNYANRLGIGGALANGNQIDDLFWRSDASSVAWMGDLRCYTRMPASDASVQFSKAPTNFFAQNSATTNNSSVLSANNIRSNGVVAPTTGTLVSLTFNFSAGITGHAKMALYDATGVGGGAGTLLATSAELTNPGVGVNVFTVTGGPTVQRGTTYYVALWSDVTITPLGTTVPLSSANLALTYTTSFPSTLVGFNTTSTQGMGSNGMNVTPVNAGCVNEVQQDTTTSYVYDSTPGDADFYGIAAIASTPVSTIAVTTRGYMEKSDAGTRTAAVQLKSGSATVASTTRC